MGYETPNIDRIAREAAQRPIERARKSRRNACLRSDPHLTLSAPSCYGVYNRSTQYARLFFTVALSRTNLSSTIGKGQMSRNGHS
jgi:hypothetical protein